MDTIERIKLETIYEEMIRPSNFFSSAKELIEFFREGTEEDFKAGIQACLDDEAYRYANILSNMLGDMSKKIN
jgi:hypothetical protein